MLSLLFFFIILLNFLKNFFVMRYFRFLISGLILFSISLSCTRSIPDSSPMPVLRASYIGGKATKTTFGRTTTSGNFSEIYWSEGDEINLFYSVPTTADPLSAEFATECEGPVAKFKPVGEQVNVQEIESSDQFFGLYPFNPDAVASFSNSTIRASIPEAQLAKPDIFDPAALLAAGVSSSLEQMDFYNICGGICFTLDNPEKYSSIRFSGNAGEIVSGGISVNLSEPTAPVAVPLSESGSKFVLLSPEAQGSFEKGKEYFISIIPGEFQDGFTVSFIGKDGVTLDCSCSGSVTIRRGAFLRIPSIDNPATLSKRRDGVLLSTDSQTSNCYIVNAPGTYKFPVVRGISPNNVIQNQESLTVKVLWETVNTATAPETGSVVDKVSVGRGFVYFNVPDPVLDGNALIAVLSGDDIVWSWHIWVCAGYDPGATSQLLKGKSKRMLDRNIGALSASYSSPLANGLFYQWGRKDPFPGAVENYVSGGSGAGTLFALVPDAFVTEDSSSGKTVDYSVKHPTTYFTVAESWIYNNSLWGERKTDYDPCPIGWKVPNAYSYTAAQGHITAEEAWSEVPYLRTPVYDYPAPNAYFPYYGALFELEGDNGRAWYPNTGYITLAGSLVMVGQYSCYWSYSPMGGNSYALELSQNSSREMTLSPYQWGKYRNEGHAVRCIQDN